MTEAGARPNVATIFGILDILFGILGISSIQYWNSMNAFLGEFYNVILAAGSLLSVLLLVAGIFLLMNKAVALQLNMYYAWVSIGLAVLRALYVIVKGGIPGFMIGIFSIGISIIYPILILAILLKNSEVKSFYSSK
jgi:hypothetical protein